VQNCRKESQQKLQCGLISPLNISKYDYGRIGLTVSKIDRGHSGEGSGHNACNVGLCSAYLARLCV